VSQLAAGRFVKDPRDVVRAGQVVRVKVVDVDLKRKRIALTMKLEEAVAPNARPRAERPPVAAPAPRTPPSVPATSMAAAFSKLIK
jgi:protein Tex